MSNNVLDAFKSGTYTGEKTVSRTFIANVFSYMFAALAISGVIAYVVGTNEPLFWKWFGKEVAPGVYGPNVMFYVVSFAPLALVFAMSLGYNKFSPAVLLGLFLTYSVLMGLSLSSIFIVYTLGSIANVFFIAAGMFGFMAFLGYTTKTDLTKFGALLYMALFGLILCSLINWFAQSPAMSWWISIFGVLIFTGLTAYDMQKIKQAGMEVEEGSASSAKMAIMSGLTLYLDFLNIFLFLLRLLGERE